MNVLLVDDDPITLEIMSETLSQNHGYEIETATNGDEALNRVLEGDISIVLSDWNMPGMNGVDLCRNIRKADLEPYVYIILVTAREGVANIIEGLASGADEFLSKPLDPMELKARVGSILRLKKLHDEVRMQNRELRRIQQLRNDWINTVVHDLRSPLSVIVGYTDLVLSRVPPDLRKWVDTVKSEATRVNGMLEQMLVLARSEDGRLMLSRVRSDLQGLIASSCDRIAAEAASKNVRILISLPDDRPVADVDLSIMRRVLDNLLTNAIRFSPAESEIQVVLRAEQDQIVLSVADCGPGVPAPERQRIFKPYATAHNASRGGSQHGIGLAFCRVVAEAHGGAISCHDNEPGGARFDLRLPQVIVAEEAAAAEAGGCNVEEIGTATEARTPF